MLGSGLGWDDSELPLLGWSGFAVVVIASVAGRSSATAFDRRWMDGDTERPRRLDLWTSYIA